MARRKSAKFVESAAYRKPPLRPLTDRQADLIGQIVGSDQVVTIGPAGTGKTFIPATIAADWYEVAKVTRIILTRPNVPAGRSLGYRPGTLEEKIAEWAAPVMSVITDRIGKGAVEVGMKRGSIEIVPFESMRGRSWSDAFILLDEAQNTTPREIEMFLTRVGHDCHVVVDGDLHQSDIGPKNGLAQIVEMIRRGMVQVPIVEFGLNDIVRSGRCAEWIHAFRIYA